ncbi:HNH endonuclease [Paenibacillus sp. KS-LC4]|uniref:HNH endonuclease n=1 Tax=Paenibacillus sp. KS-LC4 TaxID=2979727 RepID=UPI0030CE53E0
MAGKQVIFKPDEVRRLQQQMVRIGADTDELRRRVSGKIASWDRSLPMLSSLEQIQRQLTGLTQEAEQMTEVISKALKGIERVQAEAAQEAKQLAKGLSGLERFDLLKRVGTTGGGSYTPVPVTFRPMVTNLIDRILPQVSRDRWSSDPLVKELRRVAGLQGATAAEKLDAEMKLEAIFAERDLIAKAQTAYAVYKQFGNHLLMAEMHKQAEISREKLKALGVAESYFAPNVNMTSYFKQVPLLACDYDPSFALEGDLTTRVPLPDNARYLFMVMMAQTPGPTGELARVQLKEIHALQQTIRDAAGGLVTDVQQGQVKSGLLNVLTILQSMQALSKYDPPPKEVVVEEKPGMLEKFGQDAMQSLEIYWSVIKNQASVEWAAIKQTGNSIAEVGTDLYNAHVERANKSNDSVYDFFNNATMGLISVPGALWKEHEDRTANRNESVSAYLDYLSLGLTGMVQGAFAPENPNSKEHVQDVIGVLGLLFSVKVKAPGGIEPTVPKSPAVKPEGAGNGRGLGFGNQLVTPEGFQFMDSFPNNKSIIELPKTDVQKRYLEEMDRLKREAEGTGKGKRLELSDLTKEILETKPMNSPVPKKWYDKGGSISIDENGTWTYTNKKGQSVSYPDGYPDFSEYYHPTVGPVEITFASPTNRPADYKAANLEARLSKDSNPPVTKPNKSPGGYTWHHHQDGKTMILVEEKVHAEFTHSGGISKVNGKGNE